MGKAYRTGPRVQQTFTAFEPDYFKDSKGILQEKPTPIDCQAKIDSYRETSLSSILDKFLVDDLSPAAVDPDLAAIVDYVNYGSDLEALLEMDQIIDHYRQEFKTPNASRDEMLKAIRQKYNDAAIKLAKGKDDVKKPDKGGEPDEKIPPEPKGKSEELYPSGDEKAPAKPS